MQPKRLANIAGFELVRLFLTKRGIVAVIAFAICWLLVLLYPVAQAVGLLQTPEFANFFDSIFGAIGLSKLLSWPDAELAIYWLIALYSFPIFCLFLCSDQTVGDRQRGTLRFLSLRTTRAELLLGRFLGQVLILSILLLLTLGASLAILIYRDASLFVSAFSRSLSLFLYLLVSVLPFIALMSLLNTVAASARTALVYAILFFAVGSILVGLLSWQVPVLESLNYAFPGYQLESMAGFNASTMLSIGLPLIQSAVYLLLAERIFARSSI